MLGPALGIGLGLGGAVLGYKGQQEANEMNIANAREQRAFESEEAQKNRVFQSGEAGRQMGFQERLSSTAVRRRMADMKAAGINPILAGKYSADTPAGSAGSGSAAKGAAAHPMGNTYGAAVDKASTAIALARSMAEIKLINNKANALDPVADIGGAVGSFTEDLKDAVIEGKSSAYELGKRGGEFVKDAKNAVVESIKKERPGPAKQRTKKQQEETFKRKLKGVPSYKRKLFQFERTQ